MAQQMIFTIDFPQFHYLYCSTHALHLQNTVEHLHQSYPQLQSCLANLICGSIYSDYH